MNKRTLVLITAVVVIVVAAVAFGGNSAKLGGTTNFNALSVDSITSSGAGSFAAISGSSVQVNSGATITEHACGTTTYDPPSLVTNASTTKDVTVTGAAEGDPCIVGLTSATSSVGYLMSCRVTGSATATISIANASAGTVDYATGTLRACYFAY